LRWKKKIDFILTSLVLCRVCSQKWTYELCVMSVFDWKLS
jgi:hypothetical protein